MLTELTPQLNPVSSISLLKSIFSLKVLEKKNVSSFQQQRDSNPVHCSCCKQISSLLYEWITTTQALKKLPEQRSSIEVMLANLLNLTNKNLVFKETP